ncbi:hypothetical protein [Thiocystis violacea]|uniref:hypothetical protein n=1 Tax=Thiocystis violacea TaxID=13725 RepID=UPI001902D50C|nr:hypothetical protein [Thiocystis violacea]MBK1721696.1 hypothetical protein [Thiocystis violacea]
MQQQITRATLSTGLLAASLAMSGVSAAAGTETVPIMGAAATSELTGTVTVVNQEKRMLTIKTPDGRFEVLHVPEKVQRLDQVKIGNLLKITETEALLVDLKKGHGAGEIGVSADSQTERDPGIKPSGSIIDTVTLNGRVESIDTAKSTVTIRGPENVVTLKVEDPALLKTLAPGDGVEASYMRVISGEVSFQ